MNHSVAVLAQQVMEVIDIEASHPATCPCALCFASRIEPCNLQTGPVVPYNAEAPVLDNVAVEVAEAIVLHNVAEAPGAQALVLDTVAVGVLKRRSAFLDQSRNALRRERAKVRKLEQQIEVLKREHALAISHVDGDSSRTVTWSGAISCALRVTLGNVSANRASAVLLESKASRWSVTRWELQVSAALKYVSRCFHHAFLKSFGDGSVCMGALTDSESLPVLLDDPHHADGIAGGFKLAIDHVASDATNTSVCQGSKVFNAEVVTTIVPCMQRVQLMSSFHKASGQIRSQADIMRVEGSSARDTYALLHKQLSHLGLPSWRDLPSVANASDVRALHLFMFISDGGADQQLFKKLVKHEARFKANVWILDGDCHCHIGHLMSKDLLRLTDSFLKDVFKASFRCLSSLAKIVHVWRDNHRLMRKCMEVDHGRSMTFRIWNKVLLDHVVQQYIHTYVSTYIHDICSQTHCFACLDNNIRKSRLCLH